MPTTKEQRDALHATVETAAAEMSDAALNYASVAAGWGENHPQYAEYKTTFLTARDAWRDASKAFLDATADAYFDPRDEKAIEDTIAASLDAVHAELAKGGA